MTAFLIITALILLNALFVAAEFAIVGAPQARRSTSAPPRATRSRASVQSVLRDPQKQDRYIATAQLGITVASLGLGMYGEHVLADGIYRLLGASGRAGVPRLAHVRQRRSRSRILTYFHIVVGEMVPKSLALQRAETMALWITPPMLWTKNLLYPFVVGLNGLGNLMLRLVRRAAAGAARGAGLHAGGAAADRPGERGARGAPRRVGQMLQELFEFGDLTAAQVMVPRVRISGIALGTTPDEIRELLGASPHTRYPIYERDLDHIVGMIHIKDLLRLLLNDEIDRRRRTRARCR